jgi:hypothetical protein
MQEANEKRYRVVKTNLPEITAWKIEKRIGGGNINSLVKIFLHNFAHGKAGLDFTFDLSDKDMQRIIRDLDKQGEKEAA